ncbi:hypothetical protein J2Y41_000238 [Arthrobacter sp. 1088]|nr:hypothetical protein [Arthrobacter sp. 1088]
MGNSNPDVFGKPSTELIRRISGRARKRSERQHPWPRGRWAGALIICWTIGHVINIIVGNEWFAVAGGALEIVGLTLVAAAVWRSTNADWVARGANP